ncbi:ankyrin repeat domain-containing protein 26-like isoform X2 [Pomacea canaliculata]|uniref:ankyrin repeat domain-containing protein 26-like isoform X2 n=1 Tax=Pomacea canaliculata TaxID=400727 RepID=UPI000D73B70A|nr:ankyrin repeat domain-containing protein 26-like isoform X2 [Pomacea canaliculata]
MSKSTKRPIMDLCGNNSRDISNTTLSVDQSTDDFLFRQEVKNSKEQVKTETHKAQIISSAPSSIKTSPVSSSHVAAGRSHLSQGFHASVGSQAMGSVTQQIRQRLHVGSTHMGHHNDGLESDDSVTSDSERVDVTKYYPNLLGNARSSHLDFNIADDDVLSFTSTEFENDLPASAGPFSQDILLNLDLTDPASVVHVQDHMREMRRQIEQEKNQRGNLESKLRLLGKEKQDLFKKIESLSESKHSLAENNLELEAKLRSLEYSLSEETEKRKNADLLLGKTKEQLARKEQQFTSEVEARQQAELTMRNIQLEMRAAQNTIKELEEEREELERHLEHEHNARKLQEQINDEQMRLVQQHNQETLSASRVEHGQGECGVDGSGQEERDKLNAEIYALKMEMERQRSRLKDEINLIYTENEELQAKIEDLRNELKLNEEAFAHATIQYNMQAGSLRTEVIAINSALDKERVTREKLDAELDSLQKRMLSLGQEKDKAVQVRNELEREIQRERQSWVLDMERKEDEINNLKESIQHQNQKILGMESKLSAMENELHVSSTLLMERTSQLQHLKQEVERYKAAQDNRDSNIRLEKELTTKLQVKIENLQDRLTQSQHEVLSLKQQLESQHAAGLAASSSDSNEKLNTIISSLRSDNDRAKGMLEERNNSLLEQVSQLKEEARNADNRCITLEAECRRLQADLAEVSCKLSLSEGQLQMMIKARDELEHECGRLKLEVEKSNQKSGIAQEKVLEAQTRVSELTERLDRAERTSTQHLANTSASFTAFTRSKEELEDNMHRLQVDNARLEAELRHERDRAEMLQAELSDSDKVRNSLEALCSNLKSTTAHLEEKLGEEAASRVIFASEARDSKGLLEQELAARSRLGLRVVRLEKANKMAQMKMEEARRMTGNLEGQNASLEAQLAEKTQTTVRLQKEVANLRAHLKAAKKKLKEGGNTALPLGASQYLEFQKEIPTESGKVSTPRGGGGGDNNIDSHHHFHHIYKKEGGFTDLENLQQELEAKYRRELNRKLEEVNAYLENQARANDRLNNSHSENEARLQADKRRLEEENSNLRLQYEQAVAQRESRETEARHYKQLYESELRWRSRVGDQLFMSSSEKSLLHGLRLGSTERLKPKLHNSIGNLSMSALTDGYVDSSQIGANHSEALSNKIRAELDRSISKHLEAAPHKDIMPVVHDSEHLLLSHSLAQSSRDYIQVLKRKYCV